MLECPFGSVQILELGSIASHSAGEEVKIAFTPEHTLIYDAKAGDLIANAQVKMPA